MKQAPIKELITFEDFEKLDIRLVRLLQYLK